MNFGDFVGYVIAQIIGRCLCSRNLPYLYFCASYFGVTASETTAPLAGLVISATLTMCHLIGIPLTGT